MIRSNTHTSLHSLDRSLELFCIDLRRVHEPIGTAQGTSLRAAAKLRSQQLKRNKKLRWRRVWDAELGVSEIVREADLLLSSSARACNVLATEVDVHSRWK